jgi:DNA primase
MDVIALSEAGFAASVAPLGTAVTEAQLHLMWRISEEPVIALDGDTAGLRAAYRVIDLALPLLEAGRGLRFALMPEGKDPDDLLRAEGPAAVRRVLEAAMPMVDLLWRRETEGRVFDSPERRAALDRRLAEKTALIRDPVLKGHYMQALKDLRWEMFRAARGQAGAGRTAKAGRRPWGGPGGAGAPSPPRETTRRSRLAAEGAGTALDMRQSVILVALLRQPDLVPEFDMRLDQMDCADPALETLRRLLLDCPADQVQAAAEAELGAPALETLVSARHLQVVPCLRRSGDRELSRQTVAEEFAKLEADIGWQAELAEAEEDLDTFADEALTWRLAQAARARAQAGRPSEAESGDFDVGPNGAHIDRDEREALESLLSKIRFEKTKRT